MKIVFYIILTVLLLLYAIDENHQRVETARGRWKTEMLTTHGYPPIDEPGICFYCTYIKPLFEDNDQGNNILYEPKGFTNTLNFFGQEVDMNNNILSQLKNIASHDKNLSIKDDIMKIGDIGWGINIETSSIVLYSSIEFYDEKMKFVKNYLTKIYGKPYDEGGYSIKWSSSSDKSNIFTGSTLMHLRNVHSKESGTFLMFY